MKKTILSVVFILASGIYILVQHSGSADASTLPTVAATSALPTTAPTITDAATSVVVQTPPVSVPPPSPSSAPTPKKPTPAPVPTPSKPVGQYRDGSYTGTAGDAYYGYVQVKAIISNGKLADVQFLQYPNDRSTSRYINSQALPMLRSEALSAQSAKVDAVSGATDSSMAFKQSLSSALAQAHV